MRRIVLFLSVVAVLFSISCGSGSSSSTTTTNPVTKIADRVFLSNQATSEIEIIDAAKDVLSINSSGVANSISAGSSPTLMLETKDKKETLVYASFSNSIAVITNSSESVTNSVTLNSATESFAISNDNRFLFVAERIPIPSGATLAGAVEIFDLNNVSSGSTFVSVPGARRLVLSHNGNTLLVFSDDPTPYKGFPSNTQLFVINTANTAAGPTLIPGFDNPTFAVFSSDDSTAYVTNCGQECGGTTSSVSSVSMSLQAITATAFVPAARVGLLNGSTLYVAGTSAAGGQLSAVNVSSMTQTGPVVPIPNGVHDRISLGSNGKLFVGSRACTNTTQGCLAIYDTNSNPSSAVVHGTYRDSLGNILPGDVTALEPIPSRNVVYACEGGVVRIYDTTTSNLNNGPVINITGKAIDLKEVF